MKLFFIMREKGVLIFARQKSGYISVCLATIPIKNIIYYKYEGSLRYEQGILQRVSKPMLTNIQNYN